MTVNLFPTSDSTATAVRHSNAVAFDFQNLFRLSDEAVLGRFRLTRKVNPAVVPADFRPSVCWISRDLEAITLHFLRQDSPEDPGTEILRFSFEPPA
ncbi:MAG TPA: hypothetical protein VGD78_03515 [Chthoniobacterales bacterium]